jgi:hypothetical protein
MLDGNQKTIKESENMKKNFLVACFLTLIIFTGCSQTQTAAAKPDFHQWSKAPPMGWNSWDCYGPTVTEKEVMANADYMAEHLKRSGWEYIVVDIRWYVKNDKAGGYNQKNPQYVLDKYGRYEPSPNRFPSSAGGRGFKPLADYVHSKGLKFGIHIMRGVPVEAVKKNTPIFGSTAKASEIYSTEGQCPWLKDNYTIVADKTGSQEYYNSIFKLYASWGVDYVKVDDLSQPYHKEEIEMIRRAIDKCGRAIVLSTSPGPTPIEQAEHIKNNANLWRISSDLWDNWPQLKEHFPLCAMWAPHIGTGHWPDADMLPLGRIGIRAEVGDNRMSRLTKDEQITLMTLWSISRAPLMFGGDLPSNDEWTLSLLTNDEVLYVLNNSTNNRQLSRKDDIIIWAADDQKTGDKFAAFFNTQDSKPFDKNNALWKSDILTRETPGLCVDVNVDITGAKKLYLVVTDGGDGINCDHADWLKPILSGPIGEKKLTDLKWVSATAQWGEVAIGKSISGNELIVNGKNYSDGIGTHALSVIEYDLPAGYTHFKAKAGLDEGGTSQDIPGSTVQFMVSTEDPAGKSPKDSTDIAIQFKDLGINGKAKVRDLWSHKDIGVFEKEFAAKIARHGAGLYRITTINQQQRPSAN